MSDWKDKLKNSDLYKTGGGGMKKICYTCKKEFVPKESHHKVCSDCNRKRYETGGPSEKGFTKLPKGYLNDGYFDANDCLHEALLTEVADKIALSFSTANPKLKNHQLRRFYHHVRSAENKLNMTHDWSCVNVDVKKLKSFVAEAKGKQKVPEVFYEFINRNIDNIKDEKSFRHGFLEHFQAVIAYFTYYNPKD